GRAPLLHPDRRRVRDPEPAWGLRRPDDRTDTMDRILQQPRLAGCIRGRGRPAGAAPGTDRDLSAYADARARTGSLMRRGPSWFNVTSVAAGLAFLYLPIVILVVYSFNGSPLVAGLGGWCPRGGRALLECPARPGCGG